MMKEPGMRLQNFAEDMGIDEFLPQKRCENDKAVVVPNDGLLRPCLSCRSVLCTGESQSYIGKIKNI